MNLRQMKNDFYKYFTEEESGLKLGPMFGV